MKLPETIAVIGLGYVGLPLAVALSRRFRVVGYDRDPRRVRELRAGRDRTREVPAAELRRARRRLTVTAEEAALADAGLYIVTVPTPVRPRTPDLGAVRAASRAIGRHIRRGATVVLESTVYPGVTEEIVGATIARVSGLVPGRDFHLGYSPERMNPGDRKNNLRNTVKVVAGESPAVAAMLKRVYAVAARRIHVAPSIATAEAAKVIENAQRDINIAFVNEIALIFRRMGIRVHDVLEAARTKWNFHAYVPGLVGGHCIGVDPYYLAFKARQLGHAPDVILAGRSVNDGMGRALAADIHKALAAAGRRRARVLVLGLTFKENIPDLRNSKVVDIVRDLVRRGHRVRVHDAEADAAEARREYGLAIATGAVKRLGRFDAVIGAVPHRAYRALATADFARLLKPGGLVADIKGMWRGLALPPGARRWEI
jgi:UDP-N-acetyl-D-glucosamine/UDP-N-acetyl-D-galactosamine dehydrogenase